MFRSKVAELDGRPAKRLEIHIYSKPKAESFFQIKPIW